MISHATSVHNFTGSGGGGWYGTTRRGITTSRELAGLLRHMHQLQQLLPALQAYR
jgi:hypothetical protein